MKILRGFVAALFVAAVPLIASAPAAHAALAGPCTGKGTLQGKTYDSRTVNKVTIPRKGDVHWSGTVQTANGKRAISGSVHLKMPWPLPELSLGSWGKQSDAHANSGVYHYDLPSELAGIDMPLKGVHTERGVTCAGVVVVRLDGGGISNPAVIGAFVILVLSGVGLWVALRPKGA